MRRVLSPACRTAVVAVLASLFAPSTANAQVVSCSKFLHNHDGSWSSFITGDVLAEHGLVHIHTGERLSRRGNAGQADLARLLDALCQSDD